MTIFRLLDGMYQYMFCTLEIKKLKKEERRTRALLDPALLSSEPPPPPADREPVNAALCVRAHTVCPEYHC